MLFKKTLCIFLACLLAFIFCSCNHPNNINVPNHRLQWWLEEINWDSDRMIYDGEGITVAIIDSGVDKNHPDIKENIIDEYRVSQLNSIDEKSYLGHGTAVAGVISAKPNADDGVLGIAPGVGIISIDVSDDENGLVEKDAFIEGLKYAIEKEVQIINISMGFTEYDEIMESTIKEAIEKNIIVVAAAGNNTNEYILYPAAFEGVFCVGYYNKSKKQYFPNISNSKVIYMPGEYIVTSFSGEKQYISAEGSSVSTPILTGIIALILQKNPNISTEEIYLLLKNNEINVVNLLNIIE